MYLNCRHSHGLLWIVPIETVFSLSHLVDLQLQTSLASIPKMVWWSQYEINAKNSSVCLVFDESVVSLDFSTKNFISHNILDVWKKLLNRLTMWSVVVSEDTSKRFNNASMLVFFFFKEKKTPRVFSCLNHKSFC